MKGVGEPCAGEPHARFDGRGLETERYGVTAPAPDPTTLAGKVDTAELNKATGSDRAMRARSKTAIPGPLSGPHS